MNIKLVWILIIHVIPLVILSGTSKRNRKNKNLLGPKKLTEAETKAVVEGYKDAYDRCQINFKFERWNCPKPVSVKKATNPVSFTKIYHDANKEASYIYAIVAAGVTHHIITSCQKGLDKNCLCKEEPKNGLGASLATCQKKIEYGVKRARRILKQMDYKKISDPLRKAFNWKNALTGLEVYKKNIPTECRCHGVSGHCSKQTCWNTTPPSLEKTASELKELYNKAIKIKTKSLKKSIATASTAARNRPVRTLVNETKLVYLVDSPNYCKPNTKLGILGTLNRECAHTKDNSCNKLCSSCGYRNHSYFKTIVNHKCKCKFIWCCRVTCETCVERKMITKCVSSN